MQRRDLSVEPDGQAVGVHRSQVVPGRKTLAEGNGLLGDSDVGADKEI